MTIQRRKQLDISATTFLLLCLFFGIHMTVYFLITALVIAALVAIGRRFPLVGTFILLVVCNLINGAID